MHKNSTNNIIYRNMTPKHMQSNLLIRDTNIPNSSASSVSKFPNIQSINKVSIGENVTQTQTPTQNQSQTQNRAIKVVIQKHKFNKRGKPTYMSSTSHSKLSLGRNSMKRQNKQVMTNKKILKLSKRHKHNDNWEFKYIENKNRQLQKQCIDKTNDYNMREKNYKSANDELYLQYIQFKKLNNAL